MAVDDAADALIESAPDGILVVDADGSILLANRQAVAMFGYAGDELLGARIESLLPERLRSGHVLHRARYQTEPRLRPMGAGVDLVGQRRDGSEFPVEISLSPVRRDGDPVVTAIIRDVTERRRIESERAELLAIAERARAEAERAAAMNERLRAVTDVALAHLSLDELMRELLGRVRDLLGADAASILLVDEPTQTLRVRAAVGVDETRAGVAVIPVGSGFAGRIAAERRAAIVEDVDTIEILNPAVRESGVRSMIGVPAVLEGRVLGVLHVDSRHRRTFTDDDAHLLQLVADRLALAIDRTRLYQAERDARAAAEEALRIRAETERLKDDLTNMVVHDLKNPVNGITMLVRLLLRKGSLSEGQTRNLAAIERTCTELLRLIANVLEIAKIEAGEMPVALEPIVLAELVDEVAREYGPVATETGRRFVVAVGTDLAPAVADRTLLKRVVVNLVVNALRHSDSAEVRIDASCTPTPDEVTVRVADSGRGIPEDEQPYVFEKFRTARGDATADTGLGLPFCKLAVERMGGRIALSSAPGAGTTFLVTLPGAQHAAPRPSVPRRGETLERPAS